MYHFWTARKEEISRATTGYGYRPGISIKVFALIVWGFLAAVILFGPLLPFASAFNLNETVYIKDASMMVFFRDQSGNNIGTVFETQINKQDSSPERIGPIFKEFQVNRVTSSISINQNTFEILSLSKSSESRATIDDRFSVERSIGDIDRTQKIIVQGSLVFQLKVEVGFDHAANR